MPCTRKTSKKQKCLFDKFKRRIKTNQELFLISFWWSQSRGHSYAFMDFLLFSICQNQSELKFMCPFHMKKTVFGNF